MEQAEGLVTDLEAVLVVKELIGMDDTRVFVHPGEQHIPALLEPLAGRLTVQIALRTALGDDPGVGVIGEGLQAIDMIGMVVPRDHVAGRLLRHFIRRMTGH
jgi:hypothetical protein